MPTSSEIKVHIQLAMQTAGDPLMGARLEALAFYFQGWHQAVLGQPAFQGEILLAGRGVAVQPSSRRDQLSLHAGEKLRPAPLAPDSDRLLWAVLAHYAPLPPFQLHQLLCSEPAVVAAQLRQVDSSTAARVVCSEDLAEAFSQKDLPRALVAAGFEKKPYFRPVPVPKELSEDERFAVASARVAKIPPEAGDERLPKAIDIAMDLIGKDGLAIQGRRILREWGARCKPAFTPLDLDQSWRAAQRTVTAIRAGVPNAHGLRYQFIPGGAVCK